MIFCIDQCAPDFADWSEFCSTNFPKPLQIFSAGTRKKSNKKIFVVSNAIRLNLPQAETGRHS